MAKAKAKKTTKRTTRGSKTARTAARGAGPAVGPAVRRLDAEFMKAVAARDVRGLVAAFYTADAVLMPPNHPLVAGSAAIQGFLQGLLDSGATGIKLDTQRIATAGDLAWGRGAYTLSLTPPGAAPVQDTGKYIVCYRRQAGGGWRAVADIFNSDRAAG